MDLSMLQLLHMMDDWTLCLEKGGQIDAIYSDFEKAFDKVPHKRLISKLHTILVKELSNGLSTFLKLENTESELMVVTQAGMMSLVEYHKAVFWDQFCF